MASPDAADYTYFATNYDPWKGMDACRRLAAAFAGGRDPRAEDIQAAMAAATAAFPGLQDFVDDLADRDHDPEDAMLDVGRIAAEHQGAVLAAVAKLALVGGGGTLRLARRGGLRAFLRGGTGFSGGRRSLTAP